MAVFKAIASMLENRSCSRDVFLVRENYSPLKAGTAVVIEDPTMIVSLQLERKEFGRTSQLQQHAQKESGPAKKAFSRDAKMPTPRHPSYR